MRRFWLEVAACGLAWNLAAAANLKADTPEVSTSLGRLKGVIHEQTISYRGIPYAQPPIGPKRWQPPAPLLPWHNVRDATKYGNRCPQSPTYFKILGRDEPVYHGDEDCLNLNVWVPAFEAERPFPVMVFLHGGGFSSGSGVGALSFDTIYSGEKLAAHGNVIVVTINYRLGALGFLAEPSLSATDDSGVSGNYGLMDQIAALEWVQNEIANFNGDPGNVTVFGESAGAMSICTLVAQTQHTGLFQKAIMQSGACQARPIHEHETLGRDFAEKLGCAYDDHKAQADCLRQASPLELVKAQAGFDEGSYRSQLGKLLNFVPVIDAHLLPKHPLALIREGSHQQIPMIIGTNKQEADAVFFTGLFTNRQYQKLLANSGYDEQGAALVASHYSKEYFGSYARAAAALLTDLQFNCPSQELRAALREHQPQGVRGYLFGMPIFNWIKSVMGAVHAIDLFYLFQKLKISDVMNATAMDREKVSLAMGAYWSSFAETGIPRASAGPAWDIGDSETDLVLHIEEDMHMGETVRRERCNLLNQLPVGVQKVTL